MQLHGPLNALFMCNLTLDRLVVRRHSHVSSGKLEDIITDNVKGTIHFRSLEYLCHAMFLFRNKFQNQTNIRLHYHTAIEPTKSDIQTYLKNRGNSQTFLIKIGLI